MGSSIEEKLENLENQSAKLSPSEAERAEVFGRFQHLATTFLTDLQEKNTFDGSPSQRELYQLDGEPEPIDKTLKTLEEDLFQKGINAASGGHLGYIPGGGIYLSAIGDYLAAISNVYSGVYYASPGAVEMEHACLNWLKSIFNFPKTAVGNLTSGGSVANLIGLGAARDRQQILENGVQKSVVYLTEQTHHSVMKSLRILGLHLVVMRHVPMDGENRMDAKQLQSMVQQDIANGLIPSIVIASAGTTDTGAIDPLNAIADISAANNLWMHVDAAYGGFFILTETAGAKFKGIERADSLVCDPHKGMFLPYGIGCALVKSADAVFQSHKVSANYMQDAVDAGLPLDPADVSPELTKHFRALRMWLPLKTYGIAPFKAALEEKLTLTTYFREKVVDLGFKIGSTPDLSITYFWYPQTTNEDEFNQKLMNLCHKDGRVFLSSSRVGGRFVIRLAVLSFRTHKAEIEKTLTMLKDCLAALA